MTPSENQHELVLRLTKSINCHKDIYQLKLSLFYNYVIRLLARADPIESRNCLLLFSWAFGHSSSPLIMVANKQLSPAHLSSN